MEYDISVVVPVYNAEKFIEKCLDSIMQQTIKTLELICVNDGSKDNSLVMLKQYQAKHADELGRKIVIVNKENGGPSAARNVGLKYATGRYLAFVDSDDYIEPNMYQELIEVAERQKLNVVICNVMNIYDDGKTVPSKIKVPVGVRIDRIGILKLICPTLMTEDVFGGPCNRIYKREFLVQNNIQMPEQLGYGEDAVFQMKVFDLLQDTWFDSNCYYHYIHRAGSQSSTKPGRLESTLEPLYKIRCDYGKKWGINQQLINHYFLYCAIMDLVTTVKNLEYKEKRTYLKYYLRNPNIKKALKDSNIKKEMYTPRIYYMYRLMKIFM